MYVFGERLRRSEACSYEPNIIRMMRHRKSEKLTPGCSMIIMASWLQASSLNKIDSKRELEWALLESWEGSDSRT
jgi:hypothetical protein